MAIIAVSATTEPDDRSMPPVMITCVTPMAMMPIDRDLQDDDQQALRIEEEALAAKVQPRSSKISAIPTAPGGCWLPAALPAAGRRGGDGTASLSLDYGILHLPDI